MKKKIDISISFIVDEDNEAGVKKFHDTLAGFNNQLKQDFNGEIEEFRGQLDVSVVE